MTTKKKQDSRKNGRLKVGKLRPNKETVQNLTAREADKIKGGVFAGTGASDIRCQ